MGCYSEISVNLSGQGAPQRFSGAAITADVLKTLEVNPAIGRAFNANDERDGANLVLFSESLATALYGDAATALGREIHLDNQVYTIVGVMPASFAFPSREAQLWTQLRFDPVLFKDPDARANLYVNVVAGYIRESRSNRRRPISAWWRSNLSGPIPRQCQCGRYGDRNAKMSSRLSPGAW